MKSTRTTKVFICYRREDTLDFAGRLHDRLGARYGEGNVVLDVDNVPIGVNFQKYLGAQIQQCHLLLALIGRHWLEAKDANGERRLDDPRDFVRIEIEAALQQELPIVPVLVGGAAMPREGDLPATLATLAQINAAPIASDRDFNMHVDRLVKAIDALVGSAESVLAPPVPKPISTPPAKGAPGEVLMEALKQKIAAMRPNTEWVWRLSSGWWTVHAKSSSRVIVRARPSRNLVRIRIRKNRERPRLRNTKLAYDDWIAETPESFVRNAEQLDVLFRRIEKEWG
jgi:hypothetical protein